MSENKWNEITVKCIRINEGLYMKSQISLKEGMRPFEW